MTVIDVGAGTPESCWRAWPGLSSFPEMNWGSPGPVLVVAPHPDDEILGPGGTLWLLARSGYTLSVLFVTDGEGSHPDSTAITRGALAKRRRLEAAEARSILGLGPVAVRYLSVPDGEVAGNERNLVEAIVESCEPRGIVLAPWRYDGHPDHDASGRAAAEAASAAGARLVEYPVWMWNWTTPGDQRVPWSRARSTALPATALEAKWAAVDAFTSQIAPIGPDEGDGTILPEAILAHHRRSFEIVFAGSTAVSES